jgi:1,4-alpha-glucan branching enzyme
MSASPVLPTSSVAPAAPEHTGMGAVPYVGGVTFRVWSIFADSISVVGDFNGWSTTATPLAREGNPNYWSADVKGAKAGDAYKFYVSYAANPSHEPHRMDPYASSITKDAGGNMNAVVASRNTAFDSGSYSTPAWNEAVIYELHIPTFNATPASGATPAIPGTFDTAAIRLPELAQLGINAIEIMPLGEFSGNASTGYNPGYIFAVEDTFGGPDEFRIFVNAAHALGIAVILDVVYNHVDGLDLWQFDGWSMEGRTCSWCAPQPPPVGVDGGIYFFQDSRAHTPYSHARFDVGRPEVAQYLFDNVTRWLQDRFLDGLRFDSIVSIRNIQNQYDNWQLEQPEPNDIALLQRMNGHVQNNQPWKIMIAEDLQGDARITTSANAGGYGFDAQWDDNFCGKLRWAATAPADDQRNIPDLGAGLAAMNGASAFQSIAYGENHDKDDPRQGGRLPAAIGNGHADSWFAKKQSTLAACVALTAPGIPMLFMGQEFLEYRPFPNFGGYPDPIDWGRKDTYNGIWTLYRDMIRLRRNWNNNTRGLHGRNIHVLPVFADNMLIYHRWDQGGAGDDVVVVCNFANQKYASYAIGAPNPGMWRVRFNSDVGAYDGFFDNWPSFDTDAGGPPLNGMPCTANISIGAYTCLVLSQD